jgi:hypothetical protein
MSVAPDSHAIWRMESPLPLMQVAAVGGRLDKRSPRTRAESDVDAKWVGGVEKSFS